MTDPLKTLFVVAYNGGYEGHGLPFLAFADKATALKWCASQRESFSVAEVPVFPELPATDWDSIEAVKE